MLRQMQVYYCRGEIVITRANMSSRRRPNDSGEWLAGESDARSAQRRPLSTILITNPVPGQVVDMSPLGMGLESREAIPVSAENLFTLASGSTRALREARPAPAERLDRTDRA